MFYCRCFFFSRHGISELPRPIAVKLCHMIARWVNFIMQVQKIGGHSPEEIGGQKQAKFGAISDNFRLRSRISPERDKISKIGKGCFTGDSSRVQRKKSDELWSTNYGERYVRLDPPKLHFSGDYILALRGYWPLKF